MSFIYVVAEKSLYNLNIQDKSIFRYFVETSIY